jgi:hypothetical protein
MEGAADGEEIEMSIITSFDYCYLCQHINGW